MTDLKLLLAPARSYLPVVLLALIALVLSACSSGFTVRSDTHPEADFSRYRTYGFFEAMGIEGGYNSPVYGEEFRAAISSEMDQRGYRTAARPDLLVNVTIRADDRVSVRTHTAPYMTGYYYGAPGGYYPASGVGIGVAVGSGASVSSVASVFIDLVDAREQRLVWQGVAHIDITEEVAQKLRDAVYTTVNRVLEQYPHTAGE